MIDELQTPKHKINHKQIPTLNHNIFQVVNIKQKTESNSLFIKKVNNIVIH